MRASNWYCDELAYTSKEDYREGMYVSEVSKQKTFLVRVESLHLSPSSTHHAIW